VAKGADCKSAGLRLRRFESYLSHHIEAQEANVVETPRLKASEIAEWKVADAAGISPAKVHQLCQEARDRVAIAEKWAAARPGVRSVQRKPEMTTKELKGWLEGCPS
jgi:hypothetical protein